MKFAAGCALITVGAVMFMLVGKLDPNPNIALFFVGGLATTIIGGCFLWAAAREPDTKKNLPRYVRYQKLYVHTTPDSKQMVTVVLLTRDDKVIVCKMEHEPPKAFKIGDFGIVEPA